MSGTGVGGQLAGDGDDGQLTAPAGGADAASDEAGTTPDGQRRRRTTGIGGCRRF